MASQKASVEDRTIHISELGTPRLKEEGSPRSQTPSLSQIKYENDYESKSVAIDLNNCQESDI